MHDDLQLGVKEKVVQKMTRDGLVEENLSKGTSRNVSATTSISKEKNLPGHHPGFLLPRQRRENADTPKNCVRLKRKQKVLRQLQMRKCRWMRFQRKKAVMRLRR